MLPYELELAGERLSLDVSARGALRYRAGYGRSVVSPPARGMSAAEEERELLRLVHALLRPECAMSLRALARLARRDGAFPGKARRVRGALLVPDRSPGAPPPARPEEGAGRAFDEYDVLALAAAAGLPGALLGEVPILHLASLAGRCFTLRDPGRRTYRKLSRREMAALYPRAKKKGGEAL